MRLSRHEKHELARQLVDCLKEEKEIRKIVIFGSFMEADEPHDLDVAIFQDSTESYLPLALKYRKKVRPISRIIPLDLIPVTANASADDWFLSEILEGEVIYER